MSKAFLVTGLLIVSYMDIFNRRTFTQICLYLIGISVASIAWKYIFEEKQL